MPEINLQNIPGRLSRKAQTVVQLLDGAIRLYQDRRKPLTTIRLYRRDYQTLDAALRKLTQGGVGLSTHCYRGRQVVSYED